MPLCNAFCQWGAGTEAVEATAEVNMVSEVAVVGWTRPRSCWQLLWNQKLLLESTLGG